ncbi:uncharacterized protein LOC131891676 [Tigriopus californicus]|uniref:uncharacterized protein LOC131891676 n=1 Tax=Tigriopus californicus TaxID=6832 RepID=UPI0027D9E2EC|nr:uncharacterized protein LOC131891676 [Tigriopus californicus]
MQSVFCTVPIWSQPIKHLQNRRQDMMIATLTLAILVAFQTGQVYCIVIRDIHFPGPFAELGTNQASQKIDNDESSGMMFQEWPEQEDPSLQCDGMTSDITIRTIFTESDQNGCYLFKTPGFSSPGYPNAGGGLTEYDCRFVARFEGTSVAGTLTGSFCRF